MMLLMELDILHVTISDLHNSSLCNNIHLNLIGIIYNLT